MTEPRAPSAPAPDATLYAQYNVIARIDGILVAEEDGHALILSDRAMPHYVTDPQASVALLAAARLIDTMRDRWVRYGAGQPEAGSEE